MGSVLGLGSYDRGGRIIERPSFFCQSTELVHRPYAPTGSEDRIASFLIGNRELGRFLSRPHGTPLAQFLPDFTNYFAPVCMTDRILAGDDAQLAGERNEHDTNTRDFLCQPS
jgi:hypothetical protein